MRFSSIVTRALLAALLTGSLAASDVFAQRGGRGGDDGDRGDRGSARSSGGGGGSSFRSGGGGGGGPSIRSGGGGGGGPSMRSGGDGGGPSIRSGGEGRSSFRGGGGGGPSIRNGGDTPSVRSGGGGPSISGGEGRSSISRGAPFRGGDAGGESRSFRGSPSLGSPSGADSSVLRSRPSERPAWSQGRADTGRQRSFDPGAARQGGFSRSEYQVQRPSEDRVREFLGDRRDGDQDRSFRGGDQTRFGQGEGQQRSFSRRDFPGRDGVTGRDGVDDARRGIQDRFDQQRRDFTDSDRRDWTGRGDGERRDWASRSGDWDGRRGDWDGRRGDWDGRRGDWSRWDHSARNVRNYWHNRWRSWDVIPFYVGWWGPQWNHWGIVAHRYNRPHYWWHWPSGPRLGTWFSFGWNRPYYWDYGPGAYIYPHNNVIYVNGEWYAPAPVYYERTVTLVEQAPELTPEQVEQLEWLPLGVFALAREDGSHTDLLVQLAVTEDGVVGGNVFNQSTGETYPVRGSVEEETQRTVWGFTDASGQQVVMETSVYNLTRPQTTALIQYGPDRMEVGQLVRLEAPPEAGQQQTSARIETMPSP